MYNFDPICISALVECLIILTNLSQHLISVLCKNIAGFSFRIRRDIHSSLRHVSDEMITSSTSLSFCYVACLDQTGFKKN